MEKKQETNTRGTGQLAPGLVEVPHTPVALGEQLGGPQDGSRLAVLLVVQRKHRR